MDVLELNQLINRYVWGPEMMIVFLAVGLYLTLRSGLVQFRRFGVILRETVGAIRERALGFGGEITPFQATMIALGATMGQGNLIGVTAAIMAGGPGAIFWMWIAGLVGMATKFAEATLAVHFRQRYADGSVSGGPMFYLSKGLGLPWLGGLFAVFAAIAAFGIGNLTQSSAMAASFQDGFGVPPALTGLFVAVVVAFILAGGVARIARFAQVWVPFMVIAFLVASVLELFFHLGGIGQALTSIFTSAFNVQAAAGGAGGYAISQALKAGVGRGIFSNEAGLGSAAIAHAQAQVDHPVRQGFWGVVEVFLDTIVINTLMALIILSTGAWTEAASASQAFVLAWDEVPGDTAIASTILSLFVFTTIVSWGFYGEEAASFLLGDGIRWPYRITYVVLAFVGGLGGFEAFTQISDTLNGLMAIPNLIGLIVLGGVVARLTQGFFSGEPWVPPEGTGRGA